VWSLLRGDDVLEGGRAAGAMLLPHERRTAALLAAAAPIHLALSIGWAAVMATALPRGREPAWGVVGGMVIATLDLALIGRRIPSIRTLPQDRQWADHAAYGLSVGLVLRARRSRRPRAPAPGRAKKSVQSKRRRRATTSPLTSATEDEDRRAPRKRASEMHCSRDNGSTR
jgi:hypothetical protein